MQAVASALIGVAVLLDLLSAVVIARRIRGTSTMSPVPIVSWFVYALSAVLMPTAWEARVALLGFLTVFHLVCQVGVFYAVAHWWSGTTALHIAAIRGRSGDIDGLLASGCDINAQDVGGQTPLHWAVQSRNATMIELLLSRGADPGVRDSGGRTPEDLAHSHGSPTSLAALFRRGEDDL